MQNVIIGTAGHIDHGKTTLIKALTGRNTDTLEEEKKRGISINLGFTYFDLPSGKRAGIVDVPGHEKFIKNMLAGATGIDIVLLTIAVNEGVMPQTVEHIDILNYLNIEKSIIVLTKCDTVEEQWKELVIEDVKEKVSGTMFESAEIIEVDSISGNGIEQLIKQIDQMTEIVRVKNTRTSPRLNIDRVFSLKGFGTIVTGTLSEGAISVEDELVIYPHKHKAKIRNIQVHEQNVNTAYAGQRTAINIANIKTTDVKRGDVLGVVDAMKATKFLDVKIELVKSFERELRLWSRVRVFLGTKEVLARLVPLDKEMIAGGEGGFCQLRLEETVYVKKGDRFVLRFFSPVSTIGGGIVLDPNPKKHGTSDIAILQKLQMQFEGDDKEIIENYIEDNGEKKVTLKDILGYISKDDTVTQGLVKELVDEEIICEINQAFYHLNTIEQIQMSLVEKLSIFHQKFNLKEGLSKEELRKSVKIKFATKEWDILLGKIESDKLIKIQSNIVSLHGFSVEYNEKQKKIKDEIEQVLLKSKFTPPTLEALTNHQSKSYLEVLESLLNKSVVGLDQQTVIHKDYYDQAKAIVLEKLDKNGEITLAELRDEIQSSRKYAVLLLDDFDKKKMTRRIEDKRVRFGV